MSSRNVTRRAGWIACAVVLFALVAPSAPVAAHAVLVASQPAAGERLERSPQTIILRFDEPVESALGSLRVLDDRGAVRSAPAIIHPAGDPRSIAVRVGTLERGRYVVAWQVVSADSHIVRGAFAFGVGIAAGGAPGVNSDARADQLLMLLHFAILAGALLAIGLAVGSAAIRRRQQTARNPVEFAAWFMLAFSAFTDVALRADLAGGTLAGALTTRVGMLRSLTVAASLAALLAIGGKRRRLLLLLGACFAASLSLSLAGHAADGEPVGLGVATDMLHLLAAATWIGALAIAVMGESSPDMRRISRIAATAAGAVIVSGVVQAARDVGSLPLMITTGYGRAVSVKIGLLSGALALALSVRRSLARPVYAIEKRLKFELALLAAVVVATAVLVETPLPRDTAPALSAATSFAITNITVHVWATATDPRHWTIHVDGTGPHGDPRELDAVGATVRETQRNVGPLVVPMTRDAAGSSSGIITLPFAGRWRASVSARLGDFDEGHRTFFLPGSP